MGNEDFFGVDLDKATTEINEKYNSDSGNQSGSDLAPPSSQEKTVVESNKTSPEAKSTEATKQEVVDLDKLQRFRFAGREWAPKELQTAHMLQQDYSRKTAALAETRKYADNFAYDLDRVLDKPELLGEFKRVYPKEFHATVERALQRFQAQQQSANPQQPVARPQMDPQFQRELEELKAWRKDQEERLAQADAQAKEQWLDSQFGALQKKFPLANTRAVLSDANALVDLEQKVDEKVLEKLFQQSQKEVESLYASHYKTKVESQLKASAKGKDISSGGGTPGSSPRVAKNLAEAERFMLEDYQARLRS